MRRAAVIGVTLAALAGSAAAQDAVGPATEGPSPAPAGAPAAVGQALLTIDQERLYLQSAWGRRALRELAGMSRQVAADNDRSFAELSAVEEELTQARAKLSPEEFRARATAFDERVTQIRREREAAARAVGQAAERDRTLFFQSVAPILGELMAERGALVVLDERTVLFADDRIDVTEALIERLNATLADGTEILRAAEQAEARKAEAAAASANAAPGPEGTAVPGGMPAVPAPGAAAGAASDPASGAPEASRADGAGSGPASLPPTGAAVPPPSDPPPSVLPPSVLPPSDLLPSDSPASGAGAFGAGQADGETGGASPSGAPQAADALR